jgi:hypothetical protein
MNKLQSSVFHDLCRNQGTFPIEKIILSVKEPKLKVQIEKIQQFFLQGKKEQANDHKKHLPAFTPSGVFSNGRRRELIQIYNPIICLDFDNVNDSLADLRKKVDAIPTTYASFISPKGNGLKVFVLTNNSINDHSQAFNQVADFYEKETGVKSDRSVKDIPRLCFLSYDPNLYFNKSSTIFQIEKGPELLLQKREEEQDHAETFANCVNITEKNGYYINGNRNNFIFRLASSCKISGIPFEETLSLCNTHYDLDIKELTLCVKSAFKHNNVGFAAFADFAPSCHFNSPCDNFLKNSPTIPLEDYELMPEIIKQGALAFSDPRERDIFFTGALSILSGCLPNVAGTYDQQLVYPNLFTFIISPPASGKSALKYSRELGHKIQQELLASSIEKQKTYQKDLHSYKIRSRKKNCNVQEEPPVPPRFKVFYIPANSSNAKILSHLQDNGGSGVICETEADTMGKILKQEWGSYSDMLRKAFHHETITCSRKTNNEYLEISNPRLSVALTGTPSQISGLISSAQDGLFSRFLFYVFKTGSAWHDVSPKPGKPSLSVTFSYISNNIYNIILYNKEREMTFLLTQNQWETLNESFSNMLSNVTTFTSENAAGVVKRLGLLLYRIAMIFTAFRKYEGKSEETERYCSDEDFFLALRLSRIYLQHSLIMFNSLPKEEAKIVFSEAPNKEAFFHALPKTFSRSQAITIGLEHNLGTRTIDGLLKKLLESKLKKVSNGMYQKT